MDKQLLVQLLLILAKQVVSAESAAIPDLESTVQRLERELESLKKEVLEPRTRSAIDYVDFQEIIGSYVFYASDAKASNGTSLLPNGVIPLLGGILNPYHFTDALQTLKSRVPLSWHTQDATGRLLIQLPNAADRVIQFNPQLSFGAFEEDALQDIRGALGNTFDLGGDVSGPFVRSGGGQLKIRHNLNNEENFNFRDFDAKRVARTSDRTRERTINGYLGIVCGRLRDISGYSNVYLVDDDGLYTGNSISLPVVMGAQEPVGFNGNLMATSLPPQQQVSGKVSVWRNESWYLVEDHRGKTAYFTQTVELEEYNGGPKLQRKIGQQYLVKTVGPLHPFLTLQKPNEPFSVWDGKKWIVDFMAKARAEEQKQRQILEDKKKFVRLVREALEEKL